MVGENIKNNVKDRIGAGKGFINREVNILKAIVGDVRSVAQGNQAMLPKEANFPGKKGSITETLPAALLLTLDNVSTFTQDQIRITRRWA